MPGRSPFQVAWAGIPWRALGLGFVVAVIFVTSVSTRLGAQGLHYDELHQATAAFAYVGQRPQAFAQLQVGSIPILNQNYSGAIKTAIYGIYLRLSGAGFSVLNWRLLGILIVAAALFASAVILYSRIQLAGLVAFYFLLLTDQTVLVTTRYDFGPVALALFLRLILISAWISGELSDRPSLHNSALLGALVGISLFEKLSNVVLLIPLALMATIRGPRRSWRHVGAMIAGLTVGAIPLLFANIYTFVTDGYLVSAQFSPVNPAPRVAAFPGFLREYFTLGAGDLFRGFVLGPNQHTFGKSEMLLVAVLMSGTAAAAILAPAGAAVPRAARIMLFSYIGIAVGVFLLPGRTFVHHWILGTPFHYAAVALAVSAVAPARRAAPVRPRLHPRTVVACLLVPLIILRLVGLVWLERSLLRGDASPAWDPSLTRMGEFAARKADEAVFIAADWGIATQMICFVNGTPEIVMQIGGAAGWDPSSVDKIKKFVRRSGRSEFYLVFVDPPYFVPLELRSRIIEEVDRAFARQWRRQPLDQELMGLRSVIVVKYAR